MSEVLAARAWWVKLPLSVAYENALGIIDAFDALVLQLEDEAGCIGWGESCPVAGYSPETPEEAWEAVPDLMERLLAEGEASVQAEMDGRFRRQPFVVSLFREALEDLRGWSGLRLGQPATLDLLATVNSRDPEEAAAMARGYLAQGYRTMKAKVGYDPAADARRISRLAEVLDGRAILRIDANQGYTAEQALAFAKAVPPEAIEVFEQPVPADAWSDLAAVAAASPLPIMLDESIYDDADIRRAATLPGITAVKLKLSKAGGGAGLVRQMTLAETCGLKVVVGNGVASDLGCLHEAVCCVQAGLATAGEMNGFMKTPARLTRAVLKMDGPRLLVPPVAATEVDAAAVERHTHRRIERRAAAAIGRRA